MHCWKVINIKQEYGTIRLTLLACITFVLVFSISYVSFRVHPLVYTDDYIWLFFIAIFLTYPVHKFIHYLSLLKDRKTVKFKVKLEYLFIPIFHLRIKKLVSKKRYIFTLLSPFFIINGLLIWFALSFPQYTHYACLLLAYHTSMTIPDLLCAGHLFKAPKNAFIEETPKGYEILVPLS